MSMNRRDFLKGAAIGALGLTTLGVSAIAEEKGIYTPRLPSYRLKEQAKDKQVQMITFAQFKDQDASHYGLKGSATSVERIFPPETHSGQEYLEGTAEEISDALTELFRRRKYM